MIYSLPWFVFPFENGWGEGGGGGHLSPPHSFILQDCEIAFTLQGEVSDPKFSSPDELRL